MKLILMMAMTADGIIAKNSKHLTDWTSPADKKAFFSETKKHGVIIIGSSTFDTIKRPLPKRLNIVLTLHPEKYSSQEIPGLLEFMNNRPNEILSYLENKGYRSAVLGGGPTTNAGFLKAGIVDEILITIEPKIFGNGMTFAQGDDFNLKLELLGTKLLDKNSLQLHYKVIK